MHEVSRECKFDSECERQMCIFRHEVIEEVIKKNDMTVDQSDTLDVDDEDETNDHEKDIPNRTFYNPSQVDKSSSIEFLRCEICYLQ